jgi:redox-sensitive bicupin YhaK (pirin superfamily)
MSVERRIARIVTLPPLTQGFAGPGHLMAPVIDGRQFDATDPFIMLADDHLDLGEQPIGGAHPHAGFETVTLLLDGEIYDRDEGGRIGTGEVQWMTAGKGIVHGENVAARGKVRLLQLWLTLPRRDRWTTPDYQDLHQDVIPVRREPGVTIRVYSGESGGLRAKTRNHVPVTIVEARLDPGAVFSQDLPASYNGFVFPIEGTVFAGEDRRELGVGRVGWLDRPSGPGSSRLTFLAGPDGARLVFYAGQPQGDAIVSHGPFIGDSREDIARLYAEFRSGAFVRMSELARQHR